MNYFRLIPLVLLLLPGSLLAQTGSKIGIVDYQRIISESQLGRDATAKLQEILNAGNTELEQMNADFVAAQELYQTQQAALSATARTEREIELTRMQTSLTRRQEDLDLSLQVEQQLLIAPVADLATQTVVNYGREQGYAVILDIATDQSPIVYASDIADVSTEIIRRMDAATEAQTGTAEPAATEPVLPPPADPESPQP